MRLFNNKYSYFLLFATIIGLPFFVVGLLALLDILAGGVKLTVEGENPLLVLNIGFTHNNIGLSKSFFLTCWPLFVSSVLCLRFWLKPHANNSWTLFYIALAVSFAVPIAAYSAGYIFKAWPFPISILVYILIWMAVRMQLKSSIGAMLKKPDYDNRKWLRIARYVVFRIAVFVGVYFAFITLLNVIFDKSPALYFQRPIELVTFILLTAAILAASIRDYRKRFRK